MPMRLNRAAEHRAALNWAGAVGPLACSGLIVAIVAARMLMPWPLNEALVDRQLASGLLGMLFAAQVPLTGLFVETTAWRRYAAMRRGCRVLAMQCATLGVAIGAVTLIGA